MSQPPVRQHAGDDVWVSKRIGEWEGGAQSNMRSRPADPVCPDTGAGPQGDKGHHETVSDCPAFTQIRFLSDSHFHWVKMLGLIHQYGITTKQERSDS